MKRIFSIFALQLSYVNAMNSGEYTVYDLFTVLNTEERAYIEKHGETKHKAYQNVSDGSLFDRMMSDDKRTQQIAWNTIGDTGRLTAITYQAAVAENEKIRKTQSFRGCSTN